MQSDEYRIDYHKLMFHPQRVADWIKIDSDWKKAKRVYPIYIEVSPTGACNHRCIFCAMDYIGYKRRSLDVEVMRRVFAEMGEKGVKSIMFAGEGEPFLHRNIIELAKFAVDSGIDIAFTTNGIPITEKIIESVLPITAWIKVSIDAGTPETYSFIHSTKASDFKRLLGNLKKAVEYRNNNNVLCTIGAQMLLLPENVGEIGLLAKKCRDEIGLDYLVIKPYSQHLYSKTHRYEKLDYSRIREQAKASLALSNGNFKRIYRENTIKQHIGKSKNYKMCNAVPFFWAHVMSNHHLFSCSAFLQDNRFYLGDLSENSFQEIWEGSLRMNNFLMMQDGFDIASCRINCRMNAINSYLWELKEPSPHVSFI
jgi:cyclic pyranopterin phosphate synthase